MITFFLLFSLGCFSNNQDSTPSKSETKTTETTNNDANKTNEINSNETINNDANKTNETNSAEANAAEANKRRQKHLIKQNIKNLSIKRNALQPSRKLSPTKIPSKFKLPKR